MEPRLDRSLFSHVFQYRIRSHECDRQGIVHNARYLEILEVARIEFCRDVLLIPIDAGTFAHHHKFFTVRNAIDYFSPTVFDEELTVLTRIARLGRTSVTMEQIIVSQRDQRVVLEAESVMVSVDSSTNEPLELSNELRERAGGMMHNAR
jgi:YbgC/YbaW family acyl-CoA thioester hydrolase